MGYVLREQEKQPPKEIKNIFVVLFESVSSGAFACRTGAKGYEVDAAARNVIVAAGYPSYPHATGHAIGEDAHAAGAYFASKGRKPAEIPLVENGTFTIEPRIQIPNGGSIEEMVVVKNCGAEFLSPRQKSLILVG